MNGEGYRTIFVSGDAMSKGNEQLALRLESLVQDTIRCGVRVAHPASNGGGGGSRTRVRSGVTQASTCIFCY